ncbi:SusC/RagA family TonB-linked outer membrane protein [Flammeovirga kamogawensis]|uniref:TonB-dependent receptor n=1 Tax=Flammeovirga kamogawensis TaxID=373891 RepID=A0ABX8H0X1_9BACT|nr:TonB-dependent receptor [Flammeovirga kamogawensis]MBB6463656.1 TonB-linked SusC/RagA family outer membrane protein [Flammeovirga kamogawensis]QWG09269.1 TonB-dependent receptor [Flammeovirga kamogawensis]
MKLNKIIHLERIELKNYLLLFLIFLVTNIGFGQTEKNLVSGTIKDENDEPLPGVTIRVLETGTGTISDYDGNFRVNLPKELENPKLQFSFVGLVTKEVDVKGRSFIEVKLAQDTQRLDEVIVVGYSSQKKGDLTGAISNVDAQLLKNELPTTMEQALKGKIAGVQVLTADGTPGAGTQIKIRGTNSLTAGSSPLYVIDGFPYPISSDPTHNPLSTLSPEMIEDIVVLKDASSTAIYGSQGANGVVLITTKSAKEGATQFDFKVTTGVSYLTKELEVLSPEDYLRNMMYTNLGRDRIDFEEEYNTQAWNDPSKVTNWVDEIFRTAIRYGADFSFRSSTKKMSNSLFLSVSNDEGVVINNAYKRANLRYNSAIDITDKLKLNARITFDINSRTGANWFVGGLFNNASTFSPFIPKEFTFEDMGEYLPNTRGADNPYRQVMDNEFTRMDMRPSIDLGLNYNIGKGLSWNNSFGTSYMTIEERRFSDTTLRSSALNNGEAYYEEFGLLSWRYLSQLNYNFTFMPKGHSLKALAAFEARQNINESYSVNYTNFTSESGWYGIHASEIGYHMESPELVYRSHSLASFISRIDYSFKDRYLLAATLRTDGSSRFGESGKWGIFPSAAFAWRLSEEPFFKKSDFLTRTVSNAKFRVSYGVVGNDQINDYRYSNFLNNLDRNAVFGSSNHQSAYVPYTQQELGNPNITWETSKELNLGYDLALFDDRIVLTGEFYEKITTDMLLDQRLPLMSGFESVTVNSGSVQNRGVEFSISSHVIRTKDFDFNFGFNISANRSKVLDLGDRNQLLLNRSVGFSNSENILLKEGYPIGLYFGHVMDRIMNDDNSHHNANPSDINEVAPGGQGLTDPSRSYPNGKFTFVDIDGDGRITDADRVPLAHVEPDFIGGASFRFRYKIFDLGLNFSYSYGNDLLNSNVVSLISAGHGVNNELKIIADAKWSGRNRNGTYTEDANYRRFSNSEVVEDGSFIRLNNLSFGISMPQNMLQKLNMKSTRLSYAARNLWTYTRYSGYDPEVNTQPADLDKNLQTRFLSGVDLSSYPTSTTHSIALNVTF